jgi:hypothetical protein
LIHRDSIEIPLNAIGHIADEVKRTKIEVELLIGLGVAFMATRGFGAPEALEVFFQGRGAL